jgi:signal transduction histidine kinase
LKEAGNNEDVLVLAPTGRDASLILSALARDGLRCEAVSDVPALCSRAREGAGVLLIAAEALSPYTIECLNSLLARQEPWSDLPVIVMTSSGQATLGIHQLMRTLSPAGNLSLLERPFRSVTLLSLILVALRARRRQYQVKELLEAHSQATRIRDEFISIASHELKTPITAIKLQTQLAKRVAASGPGALSAARIAKLIDTTDSQVDRLVRLVDDMLDVSRISSGKLQVHKTMFDLSTLAMEVVDRLRPQLTEAGCEVEVHQSGAVFGYWDKYRIEQVLTNLLTNAFRYAPGKPVRIKVYTAVSGEAILEVKDEGQGIPAENQERIFERFERAVPATNLSGLGLGLYICRQIVESHRGSIKVVSGAGEGSTFIVRLPVAKNMKNHPDSPANELMESSG